MIKNIYWVDCGLKLVGLFEAPNTCSYVGSHHHGQKQVTRNSPQLEICKDLCMVTYPLGD